MKHTAIVAGHPTDDLQNKAIARLFAILQGLFRESPTFFLDSAQPEELSLKENGIFPFYIGTKENNRYMEKYGMDLPREESYLIQVRDGRCLIQGSDSKGVMYGVIDFYNKYLLPRMYPHDKDRYYVPFFREGFPDFSLTASPSVKRRGLWTWGHTVLNFQGYIDHMVELKMNTLILWNDFAPKNAKELVSYAHKNGIRLYFGYSWLWDVDCLKENFHPGKEVGEQIVSRYEKEYGDLGADGIYFQSFTETEKEEVGDTVIAEAVTDFVNRTSSLFLDRHPGTELLFGLHATSVKHHLDFLKNLDKRVTVLWEDCGDFPFAYLPSEVSHPKETQDFLGKILFLRGEEEKFGAVTKGMTKLDWSNFSHLEGPVTVGKAFPEEIQKKVQEKRKIWRYLQAYWLCNGGRAYACIREMASRRKGDLLLAALLEDGAFEENIYFPAALYSEMLWDTEKDISDLVTEVALRDTTVFA